MAGFLLASPWIVATLNFLPHVAPEPSDLATGRRQCQVAQTQLEKDKNCGRENLQSRTASGDGDCPVTHLGSFMPAGHCQPPWQETQPPPWHERVGFSTLQPSRGQHPGMWALNDLGGPVWAKPPAPSVFTSHAWGREGEQTGHASGVKGGHFATKRCLIQSPICPPRLESKQPTGFPGLLG